MMEALGYECGFRFASYKPNKIPTHVYNFVICNEKKFTFDSCIESLKESPRYTYIQDMKVQYLSAPCESVATFGPKLLKMPPNQRAEAIRQNKIACGDRGNVFQQAGKALTQAPALFKEVFQDVKKISLVLPRNSFRLLVSLNVRGLATKLSKAVEKDRAKVQKFWESLGGKFDGGDSLNQSINVGKTKPALLGGGSGTSTTFQAPPRTMAPGATTAPRTLNIATTAADFAQIEDKRRRRAGAFASTGMGFYSADREGSYYMGEVATGTAAAIATATPILAAVVGLLNTIGIDKEDIGNMIVSKVTGENTLPEKFVVTDPEPQTGTGTGLLANFAPSPLVIGGVVGGLALVYFLTKKKK
jgi:hypothetical protein